MHYRSGWKAIQYYYQIHCRSNDLQQPALDDRNSWSTRGIKQHQRYIDKLYRTIYSHKLSLKSVSLKNHINAGVGLMITSYPSTGEIPFPQIVRRNQSTRSDTQKDKFTQKDKYILDFADKQCQNEKVVGGKGCSLALLTSIKTDDVCIYNALLSTNWKRCKFYFCL